jgi:hypothetical protein
MNNQEVRKKLFIIHSIELLFKAEFYAFKSIPEFDDQDKQYFAIGHIKLEIQTK